MSFFENFFKHLHAPYMFFYKPKNISEQIISNNSQASLNQSKITQSYLNQSIRNQIEVNQIAVNNFVENMDYYQTVDNYEAGSKYIRTEHWFSWKDLVILFIVIFLLVLFILVCSLNRKVRLRARSTISLVQAKIHRSQTV
jgi:hypothetical protein